MVVQSWSLATFIGDGRSRVRIPPDAYGYPWRSLEARPYVPARRTAAWDVALAASHVSFGSVMRQGAGMRPVAMGPG